jgi:c(7)-type cytochrome triheme protein
MKQMREASQRTEQRSDAKRGEAKRRVLPIVVLLLFSVCALLTLFIGRRVSAVTNETQSDTQLRFFPARFEIPAQDYSKFSHSSPGAHAALTGRPNCSSCHQRRDNSVEPRFPGHKECINCHQTQFNTPGSPICTICHTQEGLSQSNPPLKKFPALSGFNAEFDHSVHINGPADARPQASCATCHAPARRGVARTAPTGLGAHQTCFQCHTPGRQAGGNDIGSCGECHSPGQRLARISTVTRSYALGFSHNDHGPRQRLNCENCHTVLQRGLPEGKQVSATTPAEHFPNTRAQTCASCHNGQRSFGETNFNDCKRCHTGPTFRL